MSTVYHVSEVLHEVKAKLYPSNLPDREGTYIARTSRRDEATVEGICAAMKTRGGYTGSYDEAVNTVTHFLKETEYQLCNGFKVNLKIFTIHLNIGGIFRSKNEAYDPVAHPLSFKFRVLKPLRDLRGLIKVNIDGCAHTHGSIDEFLDHESGAVNATCAAGNMFTVKGRKLKIEGGDPSCGLYFVPVDDPSKAVKAAHLGDNLPARLSGITPDIPGFSEVRLEVRTQYTGATNKLLKAPYTIRSAFTLKQP